MDQSLSKLRESIRGARRHLGDLERFQARFPPLPEPQQSLPRVTWDQLERQLIDLSSCPSDAVTTLLAPLRRFNQPQWATLVVDLALLVVLVSVSLTFRRTVASLAAGMVMLEHARRP